MVYRPTIDLAFISKRSNATSFRYRLTNDLANWLNRRMPGGVEGCCPQDPWLSYVRAFQQSGTSARHPVVTSLQAHSQLRL